jgi:hypothetical protein
VMNLLNQTLQRVLQIVKMQTVRRMDRAQTLAPNPVRNNF